MAGAAFEQLAEALAEARGVLFVTGAGVSLASGIDTFRGADAGAVWKNDIMAKATLGHFRGDPADAWAWYLARFEHVRGAEPNPAHHAIASLQRWYRERSREALLVTQNIDGLHALAGSRPLVEIHGKARRVRCSARACPEAAFGTLAFDPQRFVPFQRNGDVALLPRCPHCGEGILRPHVLWFDEHYQSHPDYDFERVLSFLPCADLVLFAGTSFAVGITDWIVDDARSRGRPCWSIDPCAMAPAGVRALPGRAEDTLPALAARLGAGASAGRRQRTSL